MNWHVGFVSDGEMDTIASQVDVVSFDFVGESILLPVKRVNVSNRCREGRLAAAISSIPVNSSGIFFFL